MTAFHRIVTRRHGRALTLALNNPEKMNAVDALLHEELAQAFRFAAHDQASDVIILTGEGAHFSAGGDFAWFEAAIAGKAALPSAEEGKQIIFSLLDIPKPVIAKVRGNCVGLGCTIALFCDIVLAADNARFADPHVRAGLVAGDGGAVIWPHLVGHARAKEFLLTGDGIAAVDAARMGLINHAVPEAELDGRCDGLTTKLLSGAQLAIRATKISVNLELKRQTIAALDASIAYEMTTFASSDHREAVRAFLEKRKPKFTGR